MKQINDDIVCIIIGFFILLLIASGIALLWVFWDATGGRIVVTGLWSSLIALDIGFIVSEIIKLKHDIRNLDYKKEDLEMNGVKLEICMFGKLAEDQFKVMDIILVAIDKEYPDEGENLILFAHPIKNEEVQDDKSKG